MNVTERTNKAITGQYGYQGNDDCSRRAVGESRKEGNLAQSKALDYQESINKHRKKAEVVGATLLTQTRTEFENGQRTNTFFLFLEGFSLARRISGSQETEGARELVQHVA